MMLSTNPYWSRRSTLFPAAGRTAMSPMISAPMMAARVWVKMSAEPVRSSTAPAMLLRPSRTVRSTANANGSRR